MKKLIDISEASIECDNSMEQTVIVYFPRVGERGPGCSSKDNENFEVPNPQGNDDITGSNNIWINNLFGIKEKKQSMCSEKENPPNNPINSSIKQIWNLTLGGVPRSVSITDFLKKEWERASDEEVVSCNVSPNHYLWEKSSKEFYGRYIFVQISKDDENREVDESIKLTKNNYDLFAIISHIGLDQALCSLYKHNSFIMQRPNTYYYRNPRGNSKNS